MFVPRQIRKKKGPKPTTPDIAGDKENVARQDATPYIAGGKDNGEPKESEPQDRDQRKENAPNNDPVQRKRIHPRPVPCSRSVPRGQEPSSSTPSLLTTATPSAKVAVTQSAAAAATAERARSAPWSDPWGPSGRCHPNDLHGPCYLYWYGKTYRCPGFDHTLAMKISASAEEFHLWTERGGRRFLQRIADAIGKDDLEDVAFMLPAHNIVSMPLEEKRQLDRERTVSVAVMFRHEEDAQFVLATELKHVPEIGTGGWFNNAFRRSIGYGIRFKSSNIAIGSPVGSMREIYVHVSRFGEVSALRKLGGQSAGHGQDVEYVCRFRTAESQARALSSIRAAEIESLGLQKGDDRASTVAPNLSLIVPGGGAPFPHYRPWSIFDWIMASVVDAWESSQNMLRDGPCSDLTAYRWARDRILDHERVFPRARADEDERYLAMDACDKIRYDIEHGRK